MAAEEAPPELPSSPSSSENREFPLPPPYGTVVAHEFAALEPSSPCLSSYPSESAGPATSADAEGASRPSASSTEEESVGASDSIMMDGSKEGGAYSKRTDRSKPNLETLARGISSVMGPVMKSFDSGVEGALKSQSILASSIDRLTRELDKLLEDAPLPFAMQHAAKLSNVRSRVTSLNASLRIVQKRMENIERLIAGYAAKTKHGKNSVEATAQNVIASGAHISSNVYENDDSLMRLYSEDETNENIEENSESSESQEFSEKHVSAYDNSSFETVNQDAIVDTGINEIETSVEHVNSTGMVKDVKLDDLCSTEQNDH